MKSKTNESTDDYWIKNYLHPRYWPPIFFVSLLYFSTKLPYSVQMYVGSALGRLLYYTLPWRRIVAETNTNLIFPDWTEVQKHEFVKKTFRSLGMSLFETALCWWGKEKKIAPLCHLDGLENLQNALAKGKGVILLSAHFTCLEIGARLLAIHQPFGGIYRPSKNPMYEAFLKRCRGGRLTRAIDRADIRSFVKYLKEALPGLCIHI